MQLLRILRSPRYQALPTLGTVDQFSDQDYKSRSHDLDHEVGPPTTRTVRFRATAHLLWLLWLNLALFLISGTMFMLSRSPAQPLYHATKSDQGRNFHLKHVSMPCSFTWSHSSKSKSSKFWLANVERCPAPILDQADIRISPKRMDGTLLNTEPPVIYRQQPSREVDRAWAALYDTRPVVITRDQVLATGNDPTEVVRVPLSWGRGNDSYFGRLDVFHLLHCLDALRREVHFEHYYGAQYPGGFNTTSEMHRLHLSHCVWLLAQDIMCTASTDVYTHLWTDTLEHPFPDFNTQHQCKNYDTIMAWQEKNAVDEEEFVALRRPEGYPYRVMTHKFKEIHGWFSEHDDDGDFESGEIA